MKHPPQYPEHGLQKTLPLLLGQHLIFYSQSEKKKKMLGMKVLHSLGSCLLLLSWILLEAGVPPSPLLKVDLLTQRVKEGDPLVFLCSTEGDTTEKKFHFYKDGVEITSSEEGLLEPSTEPTNPLQNASLRIPQASFNHSGEFACSYEEKRSNRWIMSSLSQGVNITVEPGVPPSPLLKVDLLSQRVKEGDPLVFLCSTEGGITEKKFHFYKDGVEITSSEGGLLEPSTEPTNPLQNASLRIPQASFNHSGEFACSYEEKRSNRWIMSSLSQGVNITVEPASVSQEQFQLREKKEERNDLPVMEPPAATAATSSSVKHLICFIQSTKKKKKMVGIKVLHSLRPSLLLLTPPFLFLSFSPVKDPPGSSEHKHSGPT
ncbi:hypothetical protein E2320_003707 [Naja naja]|nr:hypothetical protein E2320_003707 [Naja naja]